MNRGKHLFTRLIWGAAAGMALMGDAAFAADNGAAPEGDLLGLYFGKEEKVEAATRSPRPLAEVAENVTIVTAEEIEAMHAHNVAEVLSRVAGAVNTSYGHDFANMSTIRFHFSNFEHVTVLVDSVRWNKVVESIAYTNTIPVGAIKRIEVIKGASSAAWGSALGGVINIITKDPGDTAEPHGAIQAGLGERGTHEEQGEAGGMLGPLRYYFTVANQESDGLRDDRYFENESVYASFGLDLPARSTLGLSLLNSAPRYKIFDIADPFSAGLDWKELITDREFFIRAAFSSRPVEGFQVRASAYRHANNFTDEKLFYDPLTGTVDPAWSVIRSDDQVARGVSAGIDYDGKTVAATLGADFERTRLIGRNGLTSFSSDPFLEENLGVFANATLRWNRFTVTPGLRHDAFSVSDDLLSPSLGLTYGLGDDTLIRVSVARGFRRPNAAMVQDKDNALIYYTPGNPGLMAERIWTYQAGAETTALPFGRVKLTLFEHVADRVWMYDWSNGWIANDGKFRRRGVELEAETRPVGHFSLAANYTYALQHPDDRENAHPWTANAIVRYDDKAGLGAELAGNYVWYGAHLSPTFVEGKSSAVIWDFTVMKEFHRRDFLSIGGFFKAHNLFDGSQYLDSWLQNAGRWLEAGVRLTF